VATQTWTVTRFPNDFVYNLRAIQP
jgi:hypothetical protein